MRGKRQRPAGSYSRLQSIFEDARTVVFLRKFHGVAQQPKGFPPRSVWRFGHARRGIACGVLINVTVPFNCNEVPWQLARDPT